MFDKVKDNQARLGTVRGDTYSLMVNRSLNQVLMRSINTSIVALLPVASLLFVGTYVLGGLALRDFALALFVGLLTGAYSSIFVATPILAWLKEREPQLPRAARARRRRPGQGRRSSPRCAPVVAGRAGRRARRRRGHRPPATTLDDVDDEDGADVPDHRAAHRAGAAPAPATPSAAPAAGTARVRGAANPRGRQQRRKKRR